MSYIKLSSSRISEEFIEKLSSFEENHYYFNEKKFKSTFPIRIRFYLIPQKNMRFSFISVEFIEN